MSEFVTFEISKKLKEKGFKEPCLGWYYPNEISGYDYRTLIVFNRSRYRGDRYKDLLILHDDKYIDAPTISQVLKWLRERDIMVEIIPSLVDDGTWTFSFRIQTNKFYDRATKDYTSYEQASIAGIEHCLDNLI